MAVTAIRSVSTDLPHADIYLNDLWEIEAIFVKAYSRLVEEVAITFEYEVDDLRITTREELIAHGGHATKFGLTLIEHRPRVSSRSLLSIGSIMSPQIRIPSPLEEWEWELYGRVQAIFVARRKTFKIFVIGLPHWISFLTFPIIFACISLMSQTSVFRSRPYAALLLSLGVLGALVATVGFGLFSKSHIYLQGSREDERARSARLRERVEKLLWLIVGFLLGVVGTILSVRYKH